MTPSRLFKERRIGLFSLPDDTIRNDPSLMQALMSKVIIVRAEHHFASDSIEYVGYSWLFDPVEDGFLPPRYYLNNLIPYIPVFE